MVLTFFDGTKTSTTTESSFFDITADRHYGTWIFTHNMTAADSIVIKTYIKDQNSGAMRIYSSATLTGSQSEPAYFIPYVPTKQYRVTLQRIAGTTDKAYTWQRIEIT